MKTIPSIPDFLAHRPVDRRGYPTLFMLGEEQFKGIIPNRLYTCMIDHLCGICGMKLAYWLVFVGGPKSCGYRPTTIPVSKCRPDDDGVNQDNRDLLSAWRASSLNVDPDIPVTVWRNTSLEAVPNFTDPPFHRRCVDYAFEVCPYLIGAWDRSKMDHVQETLERDPLGTAERPMKMGIYTTRTYKARNVKGSVVFLPAPPKQIEWKEYAHARAAH